MRVGSDYAHYWARRLRFGDVSAKAVLMALCNYVDEDGHACPGIATLAEDTDQSEDSVRRRLKDLEAYGVLARFARTADADGKVHVETGRGAARQGKRLADEIRLVFAATQDAIDAAIAERKAARGGVATDTAEAADEAPEPVSPSNLQGLNQDGQPLQPARAQPSQPARATLSSQEEILPPTPLTGGCVAEIPPMEGWPEFERAFTADGVPIGRLSIAQAAFATLSADERAEAVRAAVGYLAWRKAERRPPMKLSAQSFLRERGGWRRYAGAAVSRFVASAWGEDWWVILWRRAAAGTAFGMMVDMARRGVPWGADAAPTDEERAAVVQIAVDGGDWQVAGRAFAERYRLALPRPDVARFAWAPKALLAATGPPGAAIAEDVAAAMGGM